MKKLFSAMLLSAALLLPCFAQAGSGVYVTPKLVMNYQHNKSEISVAGMHAMSDSKSSFRAGAAIAVGYNFMEVFSQPLRAEAEYGFYGKNSLTRHYDAVLPVRAASRRNSACRPCWPTAIGTSPAFPASCPG